MKTSRSRHKGLPCTKKWVQPRQIVVLMNACVQPPPEIRPAVFWQSALSRYLDARRGTHPKQSILHSRKASPQRRLLRMPQRVSSLFWQQRNPFQQTSAVAIASPELVCRARTISPCVRRSLLGGGFLDGVLHGAYQLGVHHCQAEDDPYPRLTTPNANPRPHPCLNARWIHTIASGSR